MPDNESAIAIPAAPAFIGLQSYTEDQSEKFFGRDTEITTLTNLVKSNTLTIVFGKSGTGKTSLLNAGVFPKLRKDFCLPFRIRLEFNPDSPDLLSQIKKVLKQEIEKYGFSVSSYPGDETLWEYFHKESFWKIVTPILIFDQFEEIFTLAKANPRFTIKELPVFWEELSDLIENNIPQKLQQQFLNNKEEISYNYKKQKVKTVFAFREEYLPEFESINAKIPSIKHSRFRLMPMNGHQAYEVITKTWGESIKPTEAKKIVSYLTNEANEENYDVVTVEPSLLSQVCAYIDKERISQDYKTVSADLLKKYPKETILRSIYEEAVGGAEKALIITEVDGARNNGLLALNPLRVFLEEKLITSEGYRTQYSMGAADELVRPGVTVLKDRYFIRGDDKTIELTHDVLAPIIKSDRETRRKDAAIAAGRKKANRKIFAILLLTLFAAVGTYWLITWQAKKDEKKAKEEVVKLRNGIESLKQGISKDSTALASIQAAKKNKELELSMLEQRVKDFDFPNGNSDSLLLALNNLRSKFAVTKAESEDKANQIADLNRKLADLEKRNANINNSSPTDVVNKLNREIDDLKKDLAGEKNRFKLVETEIKRRNDEVNKELKGQSLNTVVVNTEKALQLLLKGTSAGPNTNVYLIPYTADNRIIIRDAEIYEITCNETALKNAKGAQKAVFYNGNYVFPDTKKGKYFVKICTYYGGYYTINKNTDGPQLIKLDASPPIQ